MTDKQSLVLLTLVAAARSVPQDTARFTYLRGALLEGSKVRIIHPGLVGGIEVALSDVRALAREGLIAFDHEDSIFGMIALTPAGLHAADSFAS